MNTQYSQISNRQFARIMCRLTGKGFQFIVCSALLCACARTVSSPTRVERVGELLRLGMEQYHEGNYEVAASKFDAALDMSGAVDYQEGVAEALNNIAAVRLRQGKHEESLAGSSRQG